MDTYLIERTLWQYFFDSFSRIYDGASATLEVMTDDLGAQMEVERQPLLGISCDATGIELHLIGRDGTHLTHRIQNPRRVLLLDRNGFTTAIEIESESEPLMILHLSAIHPSRLLQS